FEKPLNTISSTVDNYAIDAIEQMPGNAALAAEPSMKEVKEASGKLANGRAVEAHNLYGELSMLGLAEISATLKCLHNLVLTVWRLEVVPQE
ncbi:unnamed protein product, partial [Sphacelaria rigidula]